MQTQANTTTIHIKTRPNSCIPTDNNNTDKVQMPKCKINKYFPHLKASAIASNNSFCFTRTKFRIKRRYITQSQMNKTKCQSIKPPISNKAKDQFIPGANSHINTTKPIKTKVFPRATYNFLSNIKRFDYSKPNSDLGPGVYHIEENFVNKPNNVFYYYNKKLNDYRDENRRLKKANDVNYSQCNTDIMRENIVIISDKREQLIQQHMRSNSESNTKDNNNSHKKIGAFLSKVNREVFEVLPSREIVSVFVSKSQKGFPSMKNHVPGPTYYNPMEMKRKSYYSNTKHAWI